MGIPVAGNLTPGPSSRRDKVPSSTQTPPPAMSSQRTNRLQNVVKSFHEAPQHPTSQESTGEEFQGFSCSRLGIFLPNPTKMVRDPFRRIHPTHVS